MAKHKCALCGTYIDNPEDELPFKNKRYVHKTCFNASLKAIKKDKDEKLAEKKKEKKTKSATTPKPRAELKDAISEEEYAEKKQYYQYLRSLVNEELSAKVYALSDQYISRYNFSFKGMYQTLVYLNEIIEKDLTGDVVGVIPYYYTEAQKFFESVNKVAEQNKNIDLTKMYKKKTIVIQPSRRAVKQIDIEDIGKGEGNES